MSPLARFIAALIASALLMAPAQSQSKAPPKAQLADVWKPVKIGPLLPPPESSHDSWLLNALRIAASSRYILADYGTEDRILFDAKTRKTRHWKGGLVEGSTDLWVVPTFDYSPYVAVLQIQDGNGKKQSYALPDVGYSLADQVGNDALMVSERAGKIKAFYRSYFYRWDKTSRRIESSFRFLDPKTGANEYVRAALARDGENIIIASHKQITYVSTRTKKITRRVPVSSKANYYGGSGGATISRFGTYLLRPVYREGVAKIETEVVNTTTGRVLWKFKFGSEQDYSLALSPDEKWIAIPSEDRKIWEIRDLKTGVLARTLPHLYGALTGAFSPDNSMLYSTSQNSIYRQRAR